MISMSDLTQARRAVVIGALTFVIATSVVQGCSMCEPGSREAKPEYGIPPKRDIFMSRGWGAGGGPSFTARSNSDLGKRPRIIEILTNEEDGETVAEPRTEYLRSKVLSYPANTGTSSRRVYLPQLFISSGWGPLGK